MKSAPANLEFRSVSAGYDDSDPVLHGISAHIGPGLTLIGGPNGSGKSTLIEVAAGNLPLMSGECLVLGRSARCDDVRRLRTYCPHDNGLIPGLSLYEHLHLAGLFAAQYRPAVDRRIDEWGLKKWLHTQVSDLSTGNQRKAWLLVCLADTQQVVLLDEPFNGLDPESAQSLMETLKELRDSGRTLVLVSHAPPESVHSLVTSHIYVQDGQLV